MSFSKELERYAARFANIFSAGISSEYRVSSESLANLEREIGFKFPRAYSDFLYVFGDGPSLLEDPHGLILADSLLEFQKEVKDELAEEGIVNNMPLHSIIFRSIDGAEFFFFECGFSENPFVFEGRFGKNGLELSNMDVSLENYIKNALEDILKTKE